MAAAENLDRFSSAASSPRHSAATKRSVHQTLGRGLVADVLLWRKRTTSISIAAAATAFWILFDFAGYSVLSLIANSFLLLVAIVFFWAKSATLLNRPLPPIPNLEISEEVVGKAAGKARVWINCVLSVAKEIAIDRNRMVFLQVILVLGIISYVGSLCSFLTLVYVGIILSLTVPALYDKYQDRVDEKLGVLLMHCNNILNRSGIQLQKEKKTQ